MKSTIKIPLASNQRCLGEVIFTLRNEGIRFDIVIEDGFYIITLR